VPFGTFHSKMRLRRVEGKPEALVGDLEPRLDPAALLVLRDKPLVGEVGEVLPGAGAPGQVEREAKEQRDREAAGERHLGQVPLVRPEQAPVGVSVIRTRWPKRLG